MIQILDGFSYNLMPLNCGISDYRDFNRKIKDLKEFRESSDYDDVQITIEESNTALQYAKDIRKHLQNNFRK